MLFDTGKKGVGIVEVEYIEDMGSYVAGRIKRGQVGEKNYLVFKKSGNVGITTVSQRPETREAQDRINRELLNAISKF